MAAELAGRSNWNVASIMCTLFSREVTDNVGCACGGCGSTRTCYN